MLTGAWQEASSSPSATSPSRTSTRSSTPPTRRCSAGVGSTAPSTAPAVPRSWPSAGCSEAAPPAMRRRRPPASCRPATSCTRSARSGGAARAASPTAGLLPSALARGRGRSGLPHGRIPGDLDRRLRLSRCGRRARRDRLDALRARRAAGDRARPLRALRRRRGSGLRRSPHDRLIASAMARTCSGVEPQQPPTTRAPAAT